MNLMIATSVSDGVVILRTNRNLLKRTHKTYSRGQDCCEFPGHRPDTAIVHPNCSFSSLNSPIVILFTKQWTNFVTFPSIKQLKNWRARWLSQHHGAVAVWSITFNYARQRSWKGSFTLELMRTESYPKFQSYFCNWNISNERCIETVKEA